MNKDKLVTILLTVGLVLSLSSNAMFMNAIKNAPAKAQSIVKQVDSLTATNKENTERLKELQTQSKELETENSSITEELK